ncbi:hypothetical protein FEK66_25360 [Escherichia sp. E1130]|nr:hypothetical protein FEK66_25360 [Escherichia sp. E1130]
MTATSQRAPCSRCSSLIVISGGSATSGGSPHNIRRLAIRHSAAGTSSCQIRLSSNCTAWCRAKSSIPCGQS